MSFEGISQVQREINLTARVAVLESDNETLKEKLHLINQKLDSLLTFQNKGMGAFWLASTLFGTGIVGVIFAVFNHFRS